MVETIHLSKWRSIGNNNKGIGIYSYRTRYSHT